MDFTQFQEPFCLVLMLIFNCIKMKKYIYITLATVTLLSTITISCSDDWVNRPVQYSIDSENYFNSETDYNNV